MSERKKWLLYSDTDYTPCQLKDELNKRYGSKTSGKKFTNQDIYMYSKRGYLPDQYGGHKIKTIKDENIGVKILRLSKK